MAVIDRVELSKDGMRWGLAKGVQTGPHEHLSIRRLAPLPASLQLRTKQAEDNRIIVARKAVSAANRIPYIAPPHRTTPHRTAPHRATPHRTAPHHTAPHHTTPHRTAPHRTASRRFASHRINASPSQTTRHHRRTWRRRLRRITQWLRPSPPSESDRLRCLQTTTPPLSLCHLFQPLPLPPGHFFQPLPYLPYPQEALVKRNHHMTATLRQSLTESEKRSRPTHTLILHGRMWWA